MGIKRKHTDDASPTSISSAGFVSTPDAQSPTPYPQFDGTMEMDTEILPRIHGWDFSRAHRVKSSDWGNRTRKRVRDNRPDERAVHENTVHKLFLAQRQHPHASPAPPGPLPATQPAIVVSKPQKSTLHSFWNISAAPVQTPIFSYHTAPQQREHEGPRCEDCDARLAVDVGVMDVDMEMDSAEGASQFACCECGRNVCGTCAVVSEARHCLQCATRGY
ncbi:uncharacterized protein EKO05_0004049 [Ascochyta rabiei]|uniref:uncharacterized protein n=1 Tax=Didymella rabiei TaxID=5454 RepID=UPI00220809FD|nr:uncharacterized protein EKO05_0004049 [Ascochyta rabiei]UPX13543.1 hypothetical protein EKO05_0004049 [Ascochyta rabiei]